MIDNKHIYSKCLFLKTGSSITAGSEIIIYNSLGRAVVKDRVRAKVTELNTSKLQSGVYQIHVRTDDIKITKRFIKIQ